MKKLITFEQVQEVCGKHITRSVKGDLLWFCDNGYLLMCAPKNCPIWKGLEEGK